MSLYYISVFITAGVLVGVGVALGIHIEKRRRGEDIFAHLKRGMD